MESFTDFQSIKWILLYLRDHYSIDFTRSIDRLDPVQLYSTGIFLFIVCLPFIMMAHYFVFYVISNPLAKILFKKNTKSKGILRVNQKSNLKRHESDTRPFANAQLAAAASVSSSTDNIHAKILKFNIAFWKAVNYGGLFLYGLYFCFVLDQSSPAWIFDYPNFVIPLRYYSWPIAIYYHLSMAHYLYGLACLLFEPKLKDFKQMLTHHVVTLGLELCSYYVSG